MYLLTAIALGIAVWILRARHIRVLERESQGARAFDPDGIVTGARSIQLRREVGAGVLLLHGGGDTPQSLAELAVFLHARGLSVSVPLLPGHGRRIREFATITADDLTRAATEAFETLRARHNPVFVVGLSMGGALAVQLAAERRDIAALVLLAPYVSMPRRIECWARMAWLWGPLMPFVRSGEGISCRDPEQRAQSLAYGVFSASALRALYETSRRAFAALPRVTSPTLVIQSREDNRISVHAAERAFARLGAAQKRLEWTSGAAHVITVDFGRERVFVQVAEWLESHSWTSARMA